MDPKLPIIDFLLASHFSLQQQTEGHNDLIRNKYNEWEDIA